MSIQNNQEHFELTEAERAAIEEEMHHYEDARSASIESLKIVQHARGWVPDGAIPAIANILGISAADVEGVATFYSQIYRKPVGRHVIRYCDSVVCYVNGAEKMHRALVQKLNIKPGETTFDGRFTLIPTCCLGKCDKGPSMMIGNETHEYITEENLDQLLEKYQ